MIMGKRNIIDRLKQFKKKILDYEVLLGIDDINDNATQEQRLDLVKRYTELENLIREANIGREYILLYGDTWPIFDTLISTNYVAANLILQYALNSIERTIAYWGEKRIEIIPKDKTIIAIIKSYIDNTKIEQINEKIANELKLINKLLSDSNEESWQKASGGCRSILFYLNDQLCKFPEGKYFEMDCKNKNEQNRLIAYLIKNRMKSEKAKTLVKFIYDIGAKGKRSADKNEVIYCIILTYVLLTDIKSLTNFEPLEII